MVHVLLCTDDVVLGRAVQEHLQYSGFLAHKSSTII